MSVVQRGDGDGGGGQSNLEQALGVTKDALPIASSIARAGFNIAKGATALGFRIGETFLGVASKGTAAAAVGMAGAGVASSEVVGAVALGAAALRLAEIGVAAAGPPEGMSLRDLVGAAQALAWLQNAAGIAHPAAASAPAASVQWAPTRRYMRFALAAYGHLGLRAQGIIPL
eukprot:gene5882-22639_t